MEGWADRLAGWNPGRLRVLVVGAGISGLTVAAALRKYNVHPTIVDRASDLGHARYSLGLYPIGSRVLHGLGVHDAFLEASVGYDAYELHDGRGNLVQAYDMRGTFESIGPFRGLRRSELLHILQGALGGLPIHFSASATGIAQDDGGALVTFHDGTSANFDLVIGADGIQSATRALVMDKNEYAIFDTGWSCWMTWTQAPLAPARCIKEYWGSGIFLGIYPVKDAFMVCAAARKAVLTEQSGGASADHFRKMYAGLGAALVDPIAAALDADPYPFVWDLHDYRSKAWYAGRVALVGDAAAGFLPTAGIGASMAMTSATALADELSRTDARHMNVALRAYELRQKRRVEAAQSKSRELAKVMFLDSAPGAWGRDRLMKLYTPHQFAHDTIALMENQLT
ncbi:MAG TPA: NAD(P)/FAD-dependent oxidoreductase [Candidatus Baltobacteraceae bacterium]